MNLANYDLMKEYLRFKVEYHFIAGHTYNNYTAALTLYAEWLELNRGVNMFDAKPEDILAYRDSMNWKTDGSIQVQLAPVQGMYKWLCHPTIARLESNPFPPIRLPKGSTHTSVIPSAQQVFKVRQGGHKLTLRRALVFEMLLSSGMRSGELRQLRACDINWDAKPMDFELKQLSPFVGGAIELGAASGYVIKRRRRRTVFISKLAAKLLKFYIQKMGFEMDANLPIFPFSRKQIWTCISPLQKYAKLSRGGQTEKIKRQVGFLDIDVDKIDGSEEYKALVRKAQEAERTKKETADHPFYERLNRIQPMRKVSLHPHSLRHFFAYTQYFRNWHGNRRDLLTLKDLLGHNNVNQSCAYANSKLVVTSDLEWKQIMCGNGFDYQRLFYDC